jgi:hypothetical protein
MLAQAKTLASALVDEGCRLSTEALLASLFPCQDATSLLRSAGSLRAFW